VPTDQHEPARVPYGFDLPPDEHRLLRGRPPRQALDWAASALGSKARVVSAKAMVGGRSSAVHALTILDRDDRPHHVVLRRYVRPELQAEEPDLAEREATVLQVLDTSRVAAPRLLAVDVHGDEAGVPAVLMSRLRGRIDWEPTDLDAYLNRLAESLPLVHDIAVPADVAVRPYRPYELGRSLGPPAWTRHPRAWAKAIELYQGPPPILEQRFIHRDYHPGNVLWSGAAVGVVDWVHASIGSPDADAGHCRCNLAGWFGLDAADRFLELYLAASGRSEYHPYWDIAAVLGGNGDDAFLTDGEPEDEPLLAQAVSRLGR
jgi:aminoglycoside phosphotransferase (APT) family kinase protein